MAVIVLLKMETEIKALVQSNTTRQMYPCYATLWNYLELKKMQTKRKHNGDCHHNLKGGNCKNIMENTEALKILYKKIMVKHRVSGFGAQIS